MEGREGCVEGSVGCVGWEGSMSGCCWEGWIKGLRLVRGSGAVGKSLIVRKGRLKSSPCPGPDASPCPGVSPNVSKSVAAKGVVLALVAAVKDAAMVRLIN